MLKLLKPTTLVAAVLAAVLLLAACGSDGDDAVDAGVETNESTDENTGTGSDDAASADDESTDSDTTDGADSDTTDTDTDTEETTDSMEDGDSEDESSMEDDTDSESSSEDDGDADDTAEDNQSESQAVFTIGDTALVFDISECASPGESTVSFDGATEAGTAIAVQATDMDGAIVIDGPEGSWEGQITSVVVGDIGNVTVAGTAGVADDSSTTGPEEFEVTGFICA